MALNMLDKLEFKPLISLSVQKSSSSNYKEPQWTPVSAAMPITVNLLIGLMPQV